MRCPGHSLIHRVKRLRGPESRPAAAGSRLAVESHCPDEPIERTRSAQSSAPGKPLDSFRERYVWYRALGSMAHYRSNGLRRATCPRGWQAFARAGRDDRSLSWHRVETTLSRRYPSRGRDDGAPCAPIPTAARSSTRDWSRTSAGVSGQYARPSNAANAVRQAAQELPSSHTPPPGLPQARAPAECRRAGDRFARWCKHSHP